MSHAILTASHTVIIRLHAVRSGRRIKARGAGITSDNATSALRIELQFLSQSLSLTSTTGTRAGCLAVSRTQQFANLEEVGLECLHKTCSLAVLGRSTEGNRIVFDNVTNAEAVSGRGAESKVAQTRVSAVRGGQNGVIDLVPAWVAEDGGCGWCDGAEAAGAAAVGRREAVFRYFGVFG
jgi:hypothetical protein